MIAIAAFFAAAVLPAAAWPVVDPDTWWHIRAGEDVLATGAVARTDTWSIVGDGRAWTSQDWLANVVLALGYRTGPWGLTFLSVAYAVVVAGAFAILWHAIGLRAPAVGWLGRVAFLSTGLVLASTVLGVRVQVLDLALVCVVLWVCWRYVTDPRRRWLAILPPTAVLWANLHAGWLLLFLIGGAVVVGELADRGLRRVVDGRPPLSVGHVRDLLVAMVVSLGAIAINPNGVDLLRYPFDTVSIAALNEYILEWFPASLEHPTGWLALAFVGAVVLPALVIGHERLRAADMLVIGGLTVMALQAIRFLLILGPLGAAIGAVGLGPVIARSPLGKRARSTVVALGTPRRGWRGVMHAALVVLVATTGGVVTVARTAPEAQDRAIATALPADATRWLAASDVDGRLFNRYEWGGYLGQQRPDVDVFMDGRADVYGDDLLRMYVSLITLEVDPRVVLDRYDIEVAIYPTGQPLTDWFDNADGWERVYADDLAVVWRRS